MAIAFQRFDDAGMIRACKHAVGGSDALKVKSAYQVKEDDQLIGIVLFATTLRIWYAFLPDGTPLIPSVTHPMLDQRVCLFASRDKAAMALSKRSHAK